MWNYQKNILVCMIAGLGLSTCTPSDVSIPGAATIDVMNGFPDGESGYALGVSGCYARKLGDFLLMAGGCNFPDKPVSEGGIKHYYKGIYIARVDDSSSLRWVKAGELPMEAAYGATVSLPDRLIFIGGSNSSDRFSSVLSFSFDCMKDSGLICETLPPLPHAVDNMSATLLGDTLYVLGGNRNGIPSSSMFSLCLDNYSAGWTEVPFPGRPRVQPVCSSLLGKLYVFGGFTSGGDASVSTDRLCYHPESGQWQVVKAPLTTKGEPLTLTGGVSVSYGDVLLICAGGVNRDIFEDAISARYQMVRESEYLLQPIEWYRFNDQLLAYNVRSGEWIRIGVPSPMLARAGSSLVVFGDILFYIGGELKPGVRTPGICRISLQK